MNVIAVEEHFLTPEIRAAWDSSPLPDSDDVSTLHRGEIEARLDDLTNIRLQLMDETGVSKQVLSLTTPALHDLTPDTSIDLARRTNQLIAATVASHPDRFEGFATLPTPSPRDAALELDHCISKLALKGALVCGRTRDKNLDHPDFLPIFETAAGLRVPIFIHPQIPQRTVRDTYYAGFAPEVSTAFSTFALGWHYEAGIQFVRLILSGLFDRFPDLQIILGHWGEVVLFYLERLNAFSRVAKLKRPIGDCMRQNLYVTPSGMFNQPYLQRSIEIVGEDRLLFSTDYPYQYRPGAIAAKFLQDTSLTQEQKEKFAHLNWERLTGRT